MNAIDELLKVDGMYTPLQELIALENSTGDKEYAEKAAFELLSLRAELATLRAENEELSNKLYKACKALRQVAEHYHTSVRAKTLVDEIHTSPNFDTCNNGWCMEASEPLKVAK